MKIAVDFQSTKGRPTGIGVAAKHLIIEMQRIAPQWKFDLLVHPHRDRLNTLQRVYWESVNIPLKAIRLKPDILYTLSIWC